MKQDVLNQVNIHSRQGALQAGPEISCLFHDASIHEFMPEAVVLPKSN